MGAGGHGRVGRKCLRASHNLGSCAVLLRRLICTCTRTRQKWNWPRPPCARSYGAGVGPTALVARCKAAPEAVVELQRSVGNAAVVQLLRDQDASEEPSPVLGVVGRGGGQPLDSSVRAGMEQAMGADLSSVRVHTGSDAGASAQAVQAHAYTVGDEVVFAPGQYNRGRPPVSGRWPTS